ncbi:MAG: DUF6172 family protein [Betaproteobacteria bacterium]
MKKTFLLHIEGKHPERLLEASKHEVRKYVARQRRASLPEGVDYWDFACSFGLSEAEAAPVHFATLIGLMDAAAKADAASFFVAILGKHGHRRPKPAPNSAAPIPDDPS